MFRSVIDSNLQVIDCRELKLAGTFFSLTQEQADGIARRIYDYANSIFGSSCVLDWMIENRVLKDMDTSLHTRKLKNGAYCITGRGNVLCDRVYNKATLRKHVREVCYPAIPPKVFGSRQSVDHAEYYETHVIPFMNDPEQLKKAVQNLFDLENRVYLASCQYPDLFAFISSSPMESTNLFHGEFGLQIPFYCLCDEVDLWGERFYELGKELAETFPNTNAYIEVGHTHAGSYTCYFGSNRVGFNTVPDVSFLHLYLQELYLTEIGWAHFISKKTRLLIEGNTQPTDDRIFLTELKGGGQAVRVRNPVSTATISDLKSMKRYLYPMVIPRTHTFPLDWPLRRYWEYVPVFEDELTITEKGVQFQHHGQIDVDKARNLLGV